MSRPLPVHPDHDDDFSPTFAVGTHDFVIQRSGGAAGSGDDAPVVWVEYASLAGASAPELFERINQAQSVLAILRACLPADKPLKALEEELTAAAEQVMALNELDAQSEEYVKRSADTAVALVAIEKTLLDRERKVPVSWLRHQSDEYDFSESSFAHYLQFQMQHLRETPECWSRVDLLITLLARQQDPDGTYSVRPVEEVAALWSACLPHSETTPEIRKAASTFFARAAERLATLQEPEAFFTSGFYADVLGYKLALRRDYFDLQVLYQAARLNVAMDNWLDSHGDRIIRALDKLMVEAHASVRKVFLDQGRPIAEPARPVPAAKPKQAKTAAKAWPGKAAGKQKPGRKRSVRRWVAAGILLVAVALSVPALLGYVGQRRRDLAPLSAADARALHPALIKGAYSGNPPRLLVGEIDAQTWQSWDAVERAAMVAQFGRELSQRGVNNALVYRHGDNRHEVLVIHIEAGQARFIE